MQPDICWMTVGLSYGRFKAISYKLHRQPSSKELLVIGRKGWIRSWVGNQVNGRQRATA